MSEPYRLTVADIVRALAEWPDRKRQAAVTTQQERLDARTAALMAELEISEKLARYLAMREIGQAAAFEAVHRQVDPSTKVY